MDLLDSVMKESQRVLPAYVSLERKALRDIQLPNGVKIPRGSHIAIDSSLMWSSEVYKAPESFQGRRYLDLREQSGNPSHVFAASSKDHTTFGMGRSICPGRFFADNELKLCLAQILSKYEVRLQEGYSSRSLYFGFYPMVDTMAKIEVRRIKRLMRATL